MWIARDEETNALKLFLDKPYNRNGVWRSDTSPIFQLINYDLDNDIMIARDIMKRYSEQYPEVTYENSPVELVPKFK